MLKDSGISKQDQAANAQTILNVIEFMTEKEQIKEDEYVFSKFTNTETPSVESITPISDRLELSSLEVTPSPSIIKPIPSLKEEIHREAPLNPTAPPISSIKQVLNATLLQKHEIAVLKSPAPLIERPPIPARPLHTLGLDSTELKRGI
jgi:hypothetical protein